MTKKYKINLLIALCSIYILILFDWTLSAENFFIYFTTSDIARSLLLSIVISTLVFIVLENWAARNEQLEYIDSRLGKIIEYFAIGSGKNGKLERIINHFRNKGRIRWIVAKFISKKIQEDFDKIGDESEIHILNQKINHFQKLIETIIADCEEEICWTCNILPEEWFKKSLVKEKSKGKHITKFKVQDFPLLFKFCTSSAKKYRIVNLKKNEFNYLRGVGLKKENLSDAIINLENFIRINEDEINNCELYFVDLEECFGHKFSKSKSKRYFVDEDFGIYDGEVVISFDRNTRKPDYGDIILSTKVSSYLPLIEEIKDYIRTGEQQGVYRSKKIIDDLKIKMKKNNF